MSGHQWTRWVYDHVGKRWRRHCTIGGGFCTAAESAPRGQRPAGP